MEKKENQPQIVTAKKGWVGGYIVAGLIWYLAHKNGFAITLTDEVIVLFVAIAAGILYSRAKERIRFIKNNVIRSIIAAVGLIAISAFLIGALTRIF